MGVLRDATLVSGIGQFAVIQYVAASIGIEVRAINLRDASEIEQDVKRFASSPNGGLILTGSALSVVHHNLIIALAAEHKLPTVYYRRYYVTSGGLISYGFDVDEQYRGAAGYVDRMLKGNKPADRDAPIFVGNAKAGIAVRRFYAASTFGSIVLAGPYLSA